MTDVSALEGANPLWILLGNVLLRELGAPIPTLPSLLMAGAHVSPTSAAALWSVVAVVGGTLIGNAVWFAAGRRYGTGVLGALARLPLLDERSVARAESAFRKWGGLSLIVGRFVPGVGLMAPLFAGALRMTWIRFLALTSLGGTAYAVVVIGAGMLLASQVRSTVQEIGVLGLWAAMAVVAAFAPCVVALRRWRENVGVPD